MIDNFPAINISATIVRNRRTAMQTNILIIGGGFGGLEASFTLRSQLDDSTKITLIDRNFFHSFIPSIHEISSGKIMARNIQIPFATILAPAGIGFMQEEVHRIDPAERQVITSAGALTYDYLVLAAGARNNFFGVPGADEHACRFRSPEDAESIHKELVRLLSGHRRPVHIVLVGGGTEGVEVGGEIIDFIHDSGQSDELAESRITMTIVERQPSLLPGYPEKAGTFAGQYLQKRGLKLILGKCIRTARVNALSIDPGIDLPFTLLIWSGGIMPSRLIEEIPLPKESAGWLIVTDKLNSPADERIFAIGDSVSIHSDEGPIKLQRLAYNALDQAVVAGSNITYHKRGKELIPFTPRTKPQLISLGRDMGIYTKDDQFRSGAWVVSLKKAVERKYLMSCLSRPLLIRIPFGIPGSGFIQWMKLKLGI
jgi:NADH:quinone reductase (non-electrogenic)